MIKVIFSILVFVGISAHADSVQWKVAQVDGVVEAKGDLVLKEASAYMYCSYCSFASCAGGPTKTTPLKMTIKAESSSTYKVSIAPASHSSSYMFRNLSRCGYVLSLKGQQSTGESFSGNIVLATSQANAANPIWHDEMLAQGLTEVMTESPLQVEVKALGLGQPQIHPSVNGTTPYFDGN
ncbi:MAG: hypothetical protein ACXWC9_10430 [Pseudobdellovibrionaceae bacterium]